MPSRTSRRDGPRRPGRAGAWRGAVAAVTLGLTFVYGVAQDLPLSEVVPGMRGYALTEGADGVRRFEVEVIDLQRPTGPGWSTILIRTSGEFLDSVGGVAAGMSGSPVYLGPDGNERLAGALAFAFPGSDHRLALVTPIGAMRALETADGDPATPPPGGSPLAAPLLLAGASPRALAHVAPLLSRNRRPAVAIQSGVLGADAATSTASLEPGDAVGVGLVRGDVVVAAVGTVTAVDGEAVLLLGHPLLRAGATDLALLGAEVSVIVANLELPFKLANLAAEPLGTVVRDGQAGLLARTDRPPGGLPVIVRVETDAGVRTLATRVARDPALTPALVAVVVQEAVDAVRDRIGGGSGQIAWEIAFGGEDEIRLVDQRVDRSDLATSLARLAAAPVATLLDNPFRYPDLARVSVHIAVSERRSDAELIEVALETPTVAPGGTVLAFVRVQPFRGEAEVRTVRVPIPDDVEPGPLRLTFRGASVPDPLAEERDPPPLDPLRQATSGLPPVLSWGELLAALENRAQARELLVEIEGDDRPRRLARTSFAGVVDGLERVTVRVESEAEPNADEVGEESP